MYDNVTPHRILYPNEFELVKAEAPVLLYDATSQAFPLYIVKEHYESDNNAPYYEDVAPHGDPIAGPS